MMWLSAWRAKTGADSIAGYEHRALVDLIVRRTAALLKAPRLDDLVPGELLAPSLLAVTLSPRSETRVLDFGGAAGLHYLAARQALPKRPLRWTVIETPAMAQAATLADDGLRFVSTIDEGMAWLGGIDVMHSVSALQYLDDPEAALTQLIALKSPVMYWGKLMLGDRRESFIQASRLKDNGPGPLPDGVADRKVTYRAIRLARESFLDAHYRAGYRLAWKAQSTDSYLFVAE